MCVLTIGKEILLFAVYEEIPAMVQEESKTYFYLFEPSEKFACLCRYLDDGETKGEDVAFLCAEHQKNSTAKPCYIICQVHDLEQAKKIVQSYSKAPVLRNI